MSRGRTIESQPDVLSIDLTDLSDFQPERRKQPAQLVPEVRIVRGVNLEVPEVGYLNTLANFLGRRNYGKGTAVAVGSWAVTMVSATEMGKMLQAQYPKAYDSRRRTIQLHRRFAKNYAQFVENSAKGVDDQAFRTLQVRHELETIVDLDDELDALIEEAAPDVNDTQWVDASFGVTGFDKFGHSDLGLDLRNNEAFAIETESTISYLAGEGLNTNIIDRSRDPHIVVFETFGSLGGAALSA
ncbi:MAG: hypothetical protein ABIQ89_01180, partial [Candidatus Saccharimonadales bacterium]